ncbi:hypothetical protein [Lysinibacillus fusiformis]|uniref:hypothetical protein n=1 Tax=Lysinibacillus fusiformis TaxID=28031 RepID=UPI003556D9CD
MGITTSDLLNTLENFSEIFNLPPPESNDIGLWWDQVVKEMEKEVLYLLYENNVLGRHDNDTLIFMNKLLLSRISDLKILIN